MQYILRLVRVPGGCHPHDLALGGVKLHIPSSLPWMSAVCLGPSVVCHCRFLFRRVLVILAMHSQSSEDFKIKFALSVACFNFIYHRFIGSAPGGGGGGWGYSQCSLIRRLGPSTYRLPPSPKINK